MRKRSPCRSTPSPVNGREEKKKSAERSPVREAPSVSGGPGLEGRSSCAGSFLCWRRSVSIAVGTLPDGRWMDWGRAPDENRRCPVYDLWGGIRKGNECTTVDASQPGAPLPFLRTCLVLCRNLQVLC